MSSWTSQFTPPDTRQSSTHCKCYVSLVDFILSSWIFIKLNIILNIIILNGTLYILGYLQEPEIKQLRFFYGSFCVLFHKTAMNQSPCTVKKKLMAEILSEEFSLFIFDQAFTWSRWIIARVLSEEHLLWLGQWREGTKLWSNKTKYFGHLLWFNMFIASSNQEISTESQNRL